MHHLIGSGTAIDNDIVTVIAQRNRFTCDGPFVHNVQVLIDTEWPACQRRVYRRVESLGTTAHPLELVVNVQGSYITAYGGFGCTSQLNQFGNSCYRFFLDGRENDFLPFQLVHAGLRVTSDNTQGQHSVNHFRSIQSKCLLKISLMIDFDR